MTDIAFHFNVADPQDYSCRLLRKALRSGARVAVTGAATTLGDLDRLLWIFEPLEFVPHWRGSRPEALPARLRETPVVLVDHPSPAAGHRILVNLGTALPEGYDAFDRVIEIVGQDDAGRTAARDRWRSYTRSGLSIERHEARP